MDKIPFNKPSTVGKEFEFMKEAMNSGKISGNGDFTVRCQRFFEKRYDFKKCLLTTSCTDALEMAAILCEIGPGDEVILPSYTFVSCANAFVLRGAKIVFADSYMHHPNIDPQDVERKITSNTKAIVVVHYGGVACDMDRLIELCENHKIKLIEDAAQAIDSYYKDKALGSFGDVSTFSFHETKNIISGEGGMLAINNPDLIERAEIIWEKGTNRSAFYRGQVDKYTWVDMGSSFLPGELTAAFLMAQLEKLDAIQSKRIELWTLYKKLLSSLSQNEVVLPSIPAYATNNAHIFYLLCRSLEERQKLIGFLKDQNILAVFHYIPLHTSPFFLEHYGRMSLPNAEYFGDHLLRLPLYYSLTEHEVQRVSHMILEFYSSGQSN